MNCFSNNYIYPSENAAHIYNKIFDSMQQIEWEDIESLYKDIEENGWKEDHPKLINILKQEENNINLFLNTLNITFCDFYRDINTKYSNEQIKDYKKIKDLSRIALLKGKKYESSGKYSSALAIYKTLLKFSNEIQQKPVFINFMIGIAVKEMAYDAIIGLLQYSKLKENEILEINDFINKFKLKEIKFIEALIAEKESNYLRINKSLEESRKKLLNDSNNADYTNKYFDLLILELERKNDYYFFILFPCPLFTGENNNKFIFWIICS